MKVLILGAGGMGAYAARTIATFNDVTNLTIADRNADAATICAKQCGPKTVPTSFDVTNGAALKASLSNVDVVLNCVGPFFRFGVPILTAAIETRTDYLDICDDPAPTLDMLGMHEQARANNVLAIIGMGASPGISNLLAAKTCNALDEIDDLITGWNLDDGTEGHEDAGFKADAPSAAVVHWMEQCSGTVQSWVGQKLTDVNPLQPVKVDYPGLGKRTLLTVGHPEPVTLPRTFPQIANASNVMVLNRLDALAIKELATLIDAGTLNLDEAARRITNAMNRGQHSMIEKTLGWLAGKISGPSFPSIFALAKGRKDGQRRVAAATINAMPEGGMAGATSIPLAIGLKLLAQGKITAKGVGAPEAIIDPDLFFSAFEQFCMHPAPVAPGKLVDLKLS